MTDDMQQTIRDDLAFMRALAEEGRRAPLLGGSILALGGAVFALASVGHWTILARVVDAPPVMLSVVWGVAFVVFIAGLWTLKARVRRVPGAASPKNRGFGVVWQGLGFAIFAIFVALAVASLRVRSDLPMALLAPVIMALYGAGWWVAATLSERGWMRAVSLAAFATSIGLGALVGSAEQFLVYAAALVVTGLLPGLALMRAEPSGVV